MKKNRTMVVLLAIFLLLIVAYFGIGKYLKTQEKKEDAAKEAKKIYVTELSGLKAISYTDGSSTLSFSKTDDTWQYDEDSTFPLDESYVTYMESELTKIEADRKLTNPEELSSYGLDQPRYTIHLTDADGKVTDLYVGNETGEDSYLTTDQKTIYTVASTVTDSLVWDLKSMVLADTFPTISSGNLVSISIAEKGKETQYTKENEENLSACAGGLGAVDLSSITDYGIRDDEKQKKYGLNSENRITITAEYTEDGENKTLMMYIGKKDGDGTNRYVQLEGSGIVYSVSDETIESILGS